MERKLWLATRRTGIGGSDAAAILGLSPWRSPMDVWMEKRGLVDEDPNPERAFLMDLGARLEPVIAGLYERETGRDVVIPAQGIFRHKKHPVLLGTPDRLVADTRIGVELKTENLFSDEFGDPGSAEVPIHYAIQCHHYMAIMDYSVWDVAVLHAGTRFGIYTLVRDAELEAAMVDTLLSWWDRHIVAGVPPDLDGTEAWRNFLHTKFPKETLGLKKLEASESELVANLALVRAYEKSFKEQKARLENQLKEIIGEHSGVTSEYGRVTWKLTKDSKEVDWHAAFDLMARKYRTLPEMQEELLKSCTEVKPGVRRFLYTAPKGEKAYGISDSTNRPGYANAGAERDANRPALPAPAIGDSEHGAGGPGESTD
jgi:putative phage-type endonuclease